MSFSAKSSKPDKGRASFVIIESGLDPGDWVVTEGIQRAFPGAKVEPQRSELTSAAADRIRRRQDERPKPDAEMKRREGRA